MRGRFSTVLWRAKCSMPPQKSKETSLRSVVLSRDAAMAFMDADVNGNHQLSWEEFQQLVPATMKQSLSDAEVQEIFESADLDGSGTISMDEYFLWTLKVATAQTGTGLEAIFRRFDKTGEGSLDLSEFQMACDDMGFGAYAHEIFMSLDTDHSGLVGYAELLNQLTSRTGTGVIRPTTKKFLTALAVHNTEELSPEDAARLDTSSWILRARDVQELRTELGCCLLKHKLRVSDFCRIITDGKKGKPRVRRDEFHDVMRNLGFGRRSPSPSSSPSRSRSPLLHELEEDRKLLDEIFDYIDDDKSGQITIAELYDWINGSTSKRHTAEGMTLLGMSRGHAGDDLPCVTLKDIEWSVEELRARIQLMLINHDSSPLYLLKRFDDDDERFTFKEWLRMMKKLIQPEPEDVDLWDCEIRPAVHQAFREVSGGDGSLDVVELENWLNKGWIQRVQSVARQRELDAVSSMEHHRKRVVSVEEAMSTKLKGMSWMAAAKRAQEDRLLAATQLATAPTRAVRPPPRSAKKAQVPKAKPKMARPAPSLPTLQSPAGSRIQDRQPGWEVRSYLSKVCLLAQEATTRHPHDQWQLLEEARHELLENQRPRGTHPTMTHDGVIYQFRL